MSIREPEITISGDNDIKDSLSSPVPDPMCIWGLRLFRHVNTIFNVCDSCIINLQESINLESPSATEIGSNRHQPLSH